IDGAREPLDGPIHVGEQHGVVEVRQGRLEEGARRRGIADAPLAEETRQDPRDTGLSRDLALETIARRVARWPDPLPLGLLGRTREDGGRRLRRFHEALVSPATDIQSPGPIVVFPNEVYAGAATTVSSRARMGLVSGTRMHLTIPSFFSTKDSKASGVSAR